LDFNKRILVTVWIFLSASEKIILNIFFLLSQQPPVGQALLIHEVSRSDTTTHHSR